MIRSNEVRCPTCNASVAMRINRNGFWQRSVLGHFGIYPWKCGACGSVFLYRRRGHRPSAGGHVHGSGDRDHHHHNHRQA